MNQPLRKFRPERPIYLNEEILGVKTHDQAIFAIEQLRDAGFLCAYAEKLRPIHLSFDSEKDLAEFKKACKELDIKLKTPVIKMDDVLAEEAAEVSEDQIKSSYEDPDGKVHIE